MIIGHKRQMKILSMMATSAIPHAILFEGPSKLGKKRVAINFIKELFCESSNGCGKCRSCLDLEKGVHPDFQLVSPLGKGIQIAQVKEILEKLSFKPYISRLKVVLIDDAHLMNQDSQNALLKTLEEPKGDSIIILCTSNPESLLVTVRSRMQRIRFFPVDSKEISSYLKEQDCQRAEEITLFSFGRPGVALEFFLNSSKIEYRKDVIKELMKTLSSPFYMKFKYAKELAQEPERVKELLEIWLNYFRAIMLKNINNRMDTKIKEIRAIEESIETISRTNADTRMTLEILMMKL